MPSLVKLFATLCCLFSMPGEFLTDEFTDESRPYEFSFNIVDFQHRFEKKDADGLIIGEYGFITADGVYHETSYATDKDGDFKITGMKYRTITSVKDAEDLFKDKPKVAKTLTSALIKSCGGCKLPSGEDKEIPEVTADVQNMSKENYYKSPGQKNFQDISQTVVEAFEKANEVGAKAATIGSGQAMKESDHKILEDTTNPRMKDSSLASLKASTRVKGVLKEMLEAIKKKGVAGLKTGRSEESLHDKLLERMANNLYYRFNYATTSHGHQEKGYRNGNKDGAYNAKGDNGITAQVKYLSNEFGHQPNVTFVKTVASGKAEEEKLEDYSFIWYWK